jgi:hypothetical protein
MPFEKGNYVLPLDQEDVGLIYFKIQLLRRRQSRTYVPNANVGGAGLVGTVDHAIIPVPTSELQKHLAAQTVQRLISSY